MGREGEGARPTATWPPPGVQTRPGRREGEEEAHGLRTKEGWLPWAMRKRTPPGRTTAFTSRLKRRR